jgi:hypothetical protein
MELAYLLSLLIFTLAVDALALHRFFALPWRKTAYISPLINIASFLASLLVTGMVQQRYEPILTQLHFVYTRYLLIVVAYLAITLVVRVAVECAICRHWLAGAPLGRLVLVLLCANFITLLPGAAVQIRSSQPHVPAGYTVRPVADWLTEADGILFYASLDDRCLVWQRLDRQQRMLASSTLPYAGYRIGGATTNAIVLGPTNVITLSAHAGATATQEEWQVALTVSNPALVDVTRDLRTLAVAEADAIQLYTIPAMTPTQRLALASDAPFRFIAWDDAGTALVVNAVHADAAATAWCWSPEYYRNMTNSFVAGGVTVTVFATAGVQIDDAHGRSLLAPLPMATYFGIGFTPASGTFLLQCNREILALELRRKQIGHVARGLCAMLPQDTYRIPPPRE